MSCPLTSMPNRPRPQLETTRRVDEYAQQRIGHAAEERLVAVHAFDCHGAKRAGLNTAWASRLEGHYAEFFNPPDLVGCDLAEVACKIAALSGLL